MVHCDDFARGLSMGERAGRNYVLRSSGRTIPDQSRRARNALYRYVAKMDIRLAPDIVLHQYQLQALQALKHYTMSTDRYRIEVKETGLLAWPWSAQIIWHGFPSGWGVRQKIHDWLDENAIEHSYQQQFIWYLKRSEDATLFALRWA